MSIEPLMIAVNPVKAFKALLDTAEFSDGQTGYEAQIAVANAYLNGDGTGINFEKAFYWFSIVAQQGHLPAKLHIAKAFRSGRGVKKDPKEGYRRLVDLARNYNCGESAHILGNIAENSENYRTAIEWYAIAVSTGRIEAEKALETAEYWYRVAQDNPNSIHCK